MGTWGIGLLENDAAADVLGFCSTAANTAAIARSVVLMKWAIVVKCGRVSPQRAMKVTCSSHARAIARLLTIPRAYAHSTTARSIAGG